MTVKTVARDKKHQVRVLFTDDSFVLLDLDVYNASPIKEGDEISEDLLEELKARSDYERARQRALWYLDQKAYTEKALFDKLKTAGFKEASAAAVICRFKELSLLDDRRYALDFAERAAESNISKREISQKLYLKGVHRDIIKETLDSVFVDENEQIQNLIEKKYKRKLENPDKVQSVYAALIRKGFSYTAVRDALKAYSEELLYKSEEF